MGAIEYMSHFAEIDKNGIVQRVLVVDQSFIDSGVLGLPSNWIQTSYNTSANNYKLGTSLKNVGSTKDVSARKRKNYAGVGYTYDKVRDAFIPPKPFNSWLLNETTCQWYSPIPYPNDGNSYEWDELSLNWKLR